MAAPYLPVNIDSIGITITAGNWQLSWGALNPQNLSTQRVIVFCNSADGDINLILPQAGSSQSQNVNLYLIKAVSAANQVHVAPYAGDTTRGDSAGFKVDGGVGAGVCVQNLYANNWNGYSL